MLKRKDFDKEKVKELFNLLFKIIQDERINVDLRDEYMHRVEEIING